MANLFQLHRTSRSRKRLSRFPVRIRSPKEASLLGPISTKPAQRTILGLIYLAIISICGMAQHQYSAALLAASQLLLQVAQSTLSPTRIVCSTRDHCRELHSTEISPRISKSYLREFRCRTQLVTESC